MIEKKRVKDLKLKTEGRTAICRILERVTARGLAEGEAKGLAKGEAKLCKVVEKLIAAGKMTLAEIAGVSGLALREVRKLNAEMKISAAL